VNRELSSYFSTGIRVEKMVYIFYTFQSMISFSNIVLFGFRIPIVLIYVAFVNFQENSKTNHPQLLYEAKLYNSLQGGSMCQLLLFYCNYCTIVKAIILGTCGFL
jgi:hypothetical protein